MNFDKLNSIASRVFFGGGFVLLGLAFLEGIVNAFGYTILRNAYAPGRLLEFGAIALMFVVVLLLRQIREDLRKENGAS